MCPGDPLSNHSERPIPLAIVFEPVLAHGDGMGLSAPLPHQGRAALQRSAGMERTSAFLELCRQSPKPALQCSARDATGALLQLIGEPPDDQIATEAERWSDVMQRPPRTPQLLCRPIAQPGNVAIKPDRVRVRRRSFPLPFGPRPEDGSAECWRAEPSWIWIFIGWPARRCGRPDHAPLWPRQA
jgi:hypothetical protein